MPIKNGEFVKFTEDEIYDRFETNLEEIIGVTSEPGDLVTKQLKAEAKTIAELQEESLQKIYYAGYLQDAGGKELEKLVDLIGIKRQEATSSTGTVQFMRDKTPSSDYVIPRGIKVQTRGNDPIVFETTELVSLQHIDGWESNSIDDWTGDVTDFNVISVSEFEGDHALEVPAINGASISTTESFGVGTSFDLDIRPDPDSTTAIRVGEKDNSNYYEAVIDASSNDLTLNAVNAGTVEATTTNAVTIPTDVPFHVEIEWQLYGDLTVTLYETDSKDVELAEAFLDVPVWWKDGKVAIKSEDATAVSVIDDLSTTAVTANIKSVDTGIDTNIAPGSIKDMKTTVGGIEDVTNHISTGDSKKQNTDLNPLVTGEDRENDEELRERAFENTSIGGAATATAINTEIQQVDGVQSVKIFQNKTEGEKDGMPSHTYEPVVYGGSDADVGQAIFDSAAIDSQDIGGVHGVETAYTVRSDALANNETIHWSRPYKVDIDITIDLIVDDTYIGDTEIRQLIVEYIGGTELDGSFTPGLTAGEDVYEAVLKQEIVSPLETGVWEVDSLTLDTNQDGTDDTTAIGSGADVLEIADSEIARVNARDGSITINTVTK